MNITIQYTFTCMSVYQSMYIGPEIESDYHWNFNYIHLTFKIVCSFCCKTTYIGESLQDHYQIVLHSKTCLKLPLKNRQNKDFFLTHID